MARGVGECNGRTAQDVRLHAEKAAFEGQTLRTFFNSLQARTIHKLSPETRLFAEVCYEKKLVHCVATALIECARSDEGRQKATELCDSNEEKNLRMTWKPLFDHCSQLLRGHKLETTNARLSRLSDHWSKADYGSRQSQRMKELVETVVHSNAVERANALCAHIMDWVELYSVSDVPMKDTDRSIKDKTLEIGKTNVVVVDRTETFSEAESFLFHEVEKDTKIHVIVGNEDDGVRFYKRIFTRFASYGLQLNWRDKEYGRRISPKIVIGHRDFFTAQYSARKNRQLTSAVFLHCESTLEDAFGHRFEPGTLDEYLAELFVLTTITMKHFGEIKELVEDRCENLLKLMRSWPYEKQILNEEYVVALWNRCYKTYGSPLNRKRFGEDLRSYIYDAIAKKMKEFKVPLCLQGHVDQHGANFVHCALAARAAELGQDYVVLAERSSGTLALKIRLKRQLRDSFGLQQFLEMRHGCAMTPYRVSSPMVSASSFIQNYDHVLIVQRSNPFRLPPKTINVFQTITRKEYRKPKYYDSSIFEFPITISTDAQFPKAIDIEAQIYTNCLIIAVCSTNETMMNTFTYVKEKRGGNVCICETPLGVVNESTKNPSETLVVCTTTAFFEGWSHVPRTREKLRIFVYHHKLDTSALEVACDHARDMEIESFTCDVDQSKQLNVGRGSESNWWPKALKGILSTKHMEPEALIEQYSRRGDINDLLRAKKQLHKILQRISTTVKMINARLPSRKWESVDSPMDISCNGFLENARGRMRELTSMREEVERLLADSALLYGLRKAKMDEDELEKIANRNGLTPSYLYSFVRVIRCSNTPVSWSDVRTKIAKQFSLEYDAENHWELAYGRSKSDTCVIALSSECVSSATTHLHNLRLVTWPENAKQTILQCSDRNLDECTMYHPEEGLDEEGLLEMEGVTIECLAPGHSVTQFSNLHKSTALLDSVVVESTRRGCPLYLFPRRSYDRLARDLFDSGLLICRDYGLAEQRLAEYDTIQLALITDMTRGSAVERLLKAESALMEYGTIEWMDWFARRLKYFDYNAEVVRFYHRSAAERDYCVQDERLIRRLRDALTDASRGRPNSSIDKLRIDAFIYSTMDILHRGERLVNIAPPSASVDALNQLTNFIRARRMPPA